MAFVRTVLGDIPPEQLGACDAHAHIIIDPSFTTHLFPDFCLDSVEKAVTELGEFYAAGGRAVIDSMPCDSGRNVEKLAEVSRRSGVHIVAPTGIHLQKYYPPGHWATRLSAEQLADLFAGEIELGIDRNDCGGPVLERSASRAGVIKVAGGKDQLSEFEKKVFRASALAHARTGCPILTHTEEGTAGLEQIEVLRANGAPPQHVVLSHTDRKPDLEYHRALLRTGVGLEYDSAFRWKAGQENYTLKLLLALLPEFPEQIMLGMDAARRGYWHSYGGQPGLAFLLTDFSRQLRAQGIGDNLLHQVFVTNPRRYYRFAKPAQPRA